MAPILQSDDIKPLQKKRAPRDDVIKREPGKSQMVENNVENIMDMWHFCLFHVLMWRRLQSPHWSTQTWCFHLLTFFISSVVWRLEWCLSHICTSRFSCEVYLYCALSHFAFIDTPTFPPQPGVKIFLRYFFSSILMFPFYVQIENAHKTDGCKCT